MRCSDGYAIALFGGLEGYVVQAVCVIALCGTYAAEREEHEQRIYI